MNDKNCALLNKYIQQHVEDGGNMPREAALTNVVCNAVKNKDYIFFSSTLDNETIKLYDVLCYTNLSNDVFFGVVTEYEPDFIRVETGTKNGIITKIL